MGCANSQATPDSTSQEKYNETAKNSRKRYVAQNSEIFVKCSPMQVAAFIHKRKRKQDGEEDQQSPKVASEDLEEEEVPGQQQLMSPDAGAKGFGALSPSNSATSLDLPRFVEDASDPLTVARAGSPAGSSSRSGSFFSSPRNGGTGDGCGDSTTSQSAAGSFRSSTGFNRKASQVSFDLSSEDMGLSNRSFTDACASPLRKAFSSSLKRSRFSKSQSQESDPPPGQAHHPPFGDVVEDIIFQETVDDSMCHDDDDEEARGLRPSTTSLSLSPRPSLLCFPPALQPAQSTPITTIPKFESTASTGGPCTLGASTPQASTMASPNSGSFGLSEVVGSGSTEYSNSNSLPIPNLPTTTSKDSVATGRREEVEEIPMHYISS